MRCCAPPDGGGSRAGRRGASSASPAPPLPWLVVWLAPLRIEVSIHGLGALLGWLLLALLAFALLVLLPLGALLSGVVWWAAWRRRGKGGAPTA